MSGFESPDSPNERPLSKRPRLFDSGDEKSAGLDAVPSMLASLEREGRLNGSVAPASRRRPTTRLLRGLAVMGVVVGGASFALRWFDDAPTPVASSLSQKTGSSSPPAVAPISAAVEARAGSSPVDSRPSTPAKIEVAAVAVAPKSEGLVGVPSGPVAASAALPSSRNPLDRLGLVTSDSTVASQGNKKAVKAVADPSSAHAGSSAKPVTRKPGGSAPTADKGRKDEVDADTELVAAMIARLDRRGSELAPAATQRRAAAAPAGLAHQVRECDSATDLLEARRCRMRVCETHWGKSDACPASRAPKL